MQKFYAGIGSRKTPRAILDVMYELAQVLGRTGWVLRSGGADGADTEFSNGSLVAPIEGRPGFVHEGYDTQQLFLPWPGFNSHFNDWGCNAPDGDPSWVGGCWDAPAPWALAEAATFHPAWGACSQAARKLHARNVHQIRGPRQDSKLSSFVVCWTPDGATTADSTSRETGGTGQAIRIADHYGVPVFNLARLDHLSRIEGFIS